MDEKIERNTKHGIKTGNCRRTVIFSLAPKDVVVDPRC